MRGIIRTMGKRPAKIKVRVTSKNLPTNATVRVTDLMLQPNQSISGWMPHVTELPWAAGVKPPAGNR